MSGEMRDEPRHLGDPAPPAQPRVLVSRCLLGHRVRYDGRHKAPPALPAALADWALVPVCPEVEAGLGVPRPPMDLVGPPGAARPTRRDGVDLTPHIAPMLAAHRARWLAAGLDGAILKARSPSCGIGSAARFETADAVDGPPAARVDGVFAAMLRDLLPAEALIDEEALAEPAAWARFAAAVRARAARRAAAPAAADRADHPVSVSGDPHEPVGHIDHAVVPLAATGADGDHPTHGSGIADPGAAPGHRQ